MRMKGVERMITLDKYEVLEILGKGGNGVVYKVKQVGTNRVLAMKEMKIKKEQKKLWVEKESEILQGCFHPGIPVVIESFWYQDYYYMVTEFVEGVTLKEYILEKGKRTVQEVLSIGWELSEIIKYLHTRNQPIVHGDLKPENIMITQNGNLQLIDFGAASTDDWMENGCYASYGYASTQQRKGHKGKTIDDIYSFGAVLHYLLTGEDPNLPPYQRRPLRECDRSFPKSLERFLEKCLCEKEKKRFQSIEAVQQCLRTYERKERVKYLFRMIERMGYVFLWITMAAFLGTALKNWKEGILLEENRALLVGISLGILALLQRSFMFIKNSDEKGYRLEKKIWKTQKRSALFLGVCFCVLMAIFYIPSKAEEQEEKLFVTLYDQRGYKICIKEGTVYNLEGDFRLEIPKKYFSKEELSVVTITLSNENTGVKRSYQLPVCP